MENSRKDSASPVADVAAPAAPDDAADPVESDALSTHSEEAREEKKDDESERSKFISLFLCIPKCVYKNW